MPYEVRKEGCPEDKPFGVYKKGSDKKFGCHESIDAAQEQMRALYAAEGGKFEAVKIVGDWELDVLAIPFDSKDSDQQWFDDKTDYWLDNFPTPPVVHYHGGKERKPSLIGRILRAEKRMDGIWVRVQLDKTKETARNLWEAAQEGLARASSGTILHLARLDIGGKLVQWAKNMPGRIAVWPFAELSLLNLKDGEQPANPYAVALPALKNIYYQAGLELPDDDSHEPEAIAGSEAAKGKKNIVEKDLEVTKMDEKEKQAAIEEGKRVRDEELAAEKKAADEKQAEIDAAVKAALEEKEKAFEEEKKKLEEEAVKARRPGDAPQGVKLSAFHELRKFDYLKPEDMAVLVGVLNSTDGATGEVRHRASENALKALAIKLIEHKDEDERQIGLVGRTAMKAAGLAVKADEIQQQDLTGFGDEWVGIAYSQALWESIRAGSFVAEQLPSVEVPQGHESIVVPLEGADPTFYKVAEVTDTAASGWPNTTITSSQMATTNKTLSLVKMGARVLWSGELEEDSLIPFVSQLRTQLQKAGSEQLEHAIIDGDTDATASTNINDIAGTPAAGDLFLLFNGFRKSPLVTTTANSRSGGALDAEDFLETLKLMGTAGLNSFVDMTKTAFIVDLNTYWKTLELPEVKTKDVFVSPTIENGQLTGIYGRRLYASPNMHFKASDRKANTAGKVDQDTAANNTTGSILAVRWDQWLLGYRRRMTMETTRIARADATEIVALARLGLIQRDTEASAITYNVSV